MIDELRTFIAIVRTGGFHAAGQARGLSQSAVSNQIRRLEERLGYTAFDRRQRQAVLTQAGRALLDHATDIVTRMDALIDLSDPAAAAKAFDGTLHLGAIATVQSTILPPAMRIFQRNCPRTRLHVVPGVSLHLVDQLDSGQIDAAVTVRPPWGLPPGLLWHAIAQQDYGLIICPSHMQAGDNALTLLQRLPFIRYERTSFGGRSVDRYLREHRIMTHDAIEMDDLAGIYHAVALGLGVAIVPTTSEHLTVGPLMRLDLTPSLPPREIGLIERIVHSKSVVAPLLDALRQVTGTFS